jgi:trimeric autotransporter adhesin
MTDTKIILKKSNVPDNEPTGAQLDIGEVALNFPDRKLYTKSPTGDIIELGTQDQVDLQLANFDTTTTLTATEGQLTWNSDWGSLSLGLNGGATQYTLGQEELVYVKNQSGATIPKGTVVMASGTVGQSARITVAPMVSDGSVDSKFILGVTSESIANGEDGYVATLGTIRAIDTSAFSQGSVLWADPSSAGGLTATKPQAPNLKLPIAIVLSSHASVGSIYVRITAGSDLGEDHLVELSSPQDGQALLWNASEGRFENQTIPGAIVYTAGDGLNETAGEFSVNSTVVRTNDSRLTNSREWTASTVSQVEAETGTATTRRAWTAQRVRQAIFGWWNGSSDKAKLDGIESGAQVNVATNLGYTPAASSGTVTSSTGTNATISAANSTNAGLMTNLDKSKLDNIEAGAQVNVGTNLGQTRNSTSYTVTSSTGTNTTLAAATTTNAGVLVAADKAKLDGIEAGAQVNVGTNLGITGTGNNRTVTSSTGSNVTIPVATTTTAGWLSTTDKSKLDGIQAGAQVNSVTSVAGRTGAVVLTKTDVGLGNVDNTSDLAKPISTATQSALDNKVDKVAGKGLSTEDYTTAEQTKLAGIEAGAQVNVGTNLGSSGTGTTRTITSSTGSNTSITYTAADVGAAPTSRTLTAGDGLSGGGNLTANRTFAVDGTVVRTSGNQTIGGQKDFSGNGSAVFGDGAASIRVSYPGNWATESGNDHDAIRIQTNGSNESNYPYGVVGIKFATSTAEGWGPFIGATRVGGGNGDLVIKTGGQTPVERLRIADNGNITASNTITAPLFSGPVSGNAATATALQTARTINGTSFNGTANITTANWGTARTLTIGGTGKSVNGSSNVSWSLAELGVNNATLNLATSGIATGSQTWTSNQGSNSTFTVNVPGTNLAMGGSANARTITSSTGNNVSVPVATTANAGFMATGDKSKLDGIQAGAQVNTVTSVAGKTGAVTLNNADVGLSNVTNHAQVRKLASATNGNIPIWNGTSGDQLANGYGVETTLTGGSGNLARADAIKSYVDSLLASNDAMVFKGTLGVGGSFTALPTTHDVGWTIKVTTAGTYAGKVAEIGDMYVSLVSRSGSGNADADWAVIQTNIDGAVTGPASSVDNHVALFDGTTGKTIKSAGVVLGNGTLTLSTSGIATGSQTFGANQASNATFTVNVPGTNLAMGGSGNSRTITSSTGTNVSVPVVTTSNAGLMSTTDKSKLDGIAAGAQVNVGTDLGSSGTGATRTITSSTGANTSITYSAADVGAATTNHGHDNATTSVSGFMSDTDKSKLDGIQAGAQVNVATNLGQSRNATSYTVTSSTGSNTTLAAATTTNAGVFVAADKAKLDGIAAGAQVNVGTNLGYTASTRVLTSSTGTNVTLPQVTTSADGLMIASDKSKLDGIAAGAQVNVGTNLGSSGTGATRTITSSTGSNTSITYSAADVGAASIVNPQFTGFLQANSTDDSDIAALGGFVARYSLSTATGKPPGTDHALMALSYSSAWSFQFAGDWRTGALYTRKKENGTLGSWQQVAYTTSSITGNASTATTLATARTINGTSFNGSANITTANWGTARTINGSSVNGSANVTTANWGTARTLTIGSTGKSVNGSGNVSWSLAEIGAAATNHGHANATTSASGFMSDTDKSKLDGIAAGAQVNVATNLTYTSAASSGTVNSSTGTNATIPAATTSIAGLLTSSDKTKLDGIESGAQVNVGTNLGSSGTGGTRTITSSTGTNTSITYTASDVGAAAANATVNLTGDQSVSGVKTFTTAITVTGTSKAAGRFYAGTTNPSNATRLNYDGNLHVNNFVAVGDVNSSSDVRLKDNWSPLPVDFLDNLSGVLSGTYDRLDTGQRQAGVSAQDLQKVLPEAVSKDAEGYLSVDYGKAALVAVIELTKKVKELEAELVKLKAE